MNGQVCRLPEIVSGMTAKGSSTIFCRRDGELVAVPYPNCHREAALVADALRADGVRPGDRVAIHGSTSYEWVLADLGCLMAGALSVALYPSAPQARAIATAGETRCQVVFTDRAEFAAGFADEGFKTILLSSRDGANGTPSLRELLDRAGPSSSPPPGLRRAEPFTVVSTSGTLSEPKLFAVHSAPLLYTMERFAELYGFGPEERLLVYLPLSHLPQRMMLYWSLAAGVDLILSDPPHMVDDTARFSPTLHVAVPRSVQYLHKRGLEMLRGNEVSNASQAFRAVFGAAIKAIFVGSAPSDPAVLRDLMLAGLPVYEVYGTTELGMVSLNKPGATRFGTVGRAIPWGSVRIDPDNGEILAQTPTPFLYGRLIRGEIEPAIHEEESWFPTGDVGFLDEDGYLTIRGRLRDFLVLKSGEKVFVRPIEDAVAAATAASVCVLTQTDRHPVAALLFFDPATSHCGGEGRTEESCRARLEELNATLHAWERIRAFAIIERLPSVEEGTVTESSKLRRHKIEEMHVPTATWHRVREG